MQHAVRGSVTRGEVEFMVLISVIQLLGKLYSELLELLVVRAHEFNCRSRNSCLKCEGLLTRGDRGRGLINLLELQDHMLLTMRGRLTLCGCHPAGRSQGMAGTTVE